MPGEDQLPSHPITFDVKAISSLPSAHADGGKEGGVLGDGGMVGGGIAGGGVMKATILSTWAI